MEGVGTEPSSVLRSPSEESCKAEMCVFLLKLTIMKEIF